MPPKHWSVALSRTLALVALALCAPSAAHALRIVNYNILNYPGTSSATRNPHFRNVLTPLGADVVIVQEMISQAGVDLFRDQVLNILEPGQWSSAPFTDGTDTDNGLFYKTSKVTYLGQRNFYVSVDVERYVNEYRLRPAGYSSGATEFLIYSVHLKASTGDANVQQRLREATGLRDTINNLPAGSQAIVMGDYNLYTGNEPALIKFLESQVNNVGRLYDPLNLQGITWQDNASIAIHMTQCPSTTAYRPTGGYAGGGLDDRFDLFLPTLNLGDDEGLDLLENTYVSVGNDGQHLNLAVTQPPIAPADTAYARSLWWCSDHLPIRVDLQLPAKIQVLTLPIAFGTVIQGAAASVLLGVSNLAVAPADELSFSLAPPAGFTAPGGAQTANPGATTDVAIGLDTGSPGAKAGDLTITHDDPDQDAKVIALSGTVLAHAAPSLDSLEALAADTLDFGSHESGEFGSLLAAVHNRGWSSLQARLSVSAAEIVGGAGRFSIAGFAPLLVSGTAARWNVSFDDAGATADSAYQATLAFAVADEGLPGGTSFAEHVYTLRATVQSISVDVDHEALPTVSRLLAPYPNPLRGSSTVGFELALGGHVRLDVFDLAGRHVTNLADRDFAPGRFRLQWNGRDAQGFAARPGLYFVRLSGPGFSHVARLAVVR